MLATVGIGASRRQTGRRERSLPPQPLFPGRFAVAGGVRGR